MPRFGVLGSGEVGQVLARGLKDHGYEVRIVEPDAAQAEAVVATVLDQFGWDAADMGGAIAARAIEPLAVLWCIPGFLQDSWAHAFRLLR